MRFGRTLIFSALLLISALPSFAASHLRRGPTSPRLFRKRAAAARPTAKPVSQRAIDPERTTQIQTALIKQGYMTGEPSGKWDSNTQAALEKMQGDNGWQTKLVPDSRAIIKLGLGPGGAPPSPEALVSPTPSMGTSLASESGIINVSR
ncbi:peptidoglycan-binding domain-containing protein [Granulicella sibirica]|uniref:Peptidoglycan binding-like domain-containing protein n=1 Tax=Granulicella sibirica TaxID=2479048 RepID=A0A4Q0T4T5_9BACT|nr:peptidoglycan-binding domain-containing protein [Granulicella sibirica]RXH56596.1 hypothetical protein GRAN_3453 [Granulicella sibirica]